jgi:hypothetical protein
VRDVSDYPNLSVEELTAEAAALANGLSGKYKDLAAVKTQYHFWFLRGYRESTETSVAGRDRAGEIAAQTFREEELTAQGEIESLRNLLDFVVKLIDWKA